MKLGLSAVLIASVLPLLFDPATGSDNGTPICVMPGIQESPVVAGNYVLWVDRRFGPPQLYLRAPIDTNHVRDGVRIAPSQYAQTLPRMTVDGYDEATIVWSEDRGSGTGQDVYATRYDRFGRLVSGWNATGNAICVAPADQRVSGMAGPAVVWEDGRAGNSDVYATRLRRDGTTDPAWPANGLAIAASAAPDVSPVAVLWPACTTNPYTCTDGYGFAWRRGGGLHVERRNLDGTLAAGWPPDGLILGDSACAGCVSDGPLMDCSTTGLVGWTTFDGTQHDVRVTEVTPQGGVVGGWPAAGVVVPAPVGSDQFLVGVGIGYEGLVVWKDTRSDAGDLYAASFDQPNTIYGAPLAAGPGEQTQALLGTRAGYHFAVWTDFGSPYTGADVYVRGFGYWPEIFPANGPYPAAVTTGEQSHPAMDVEENYIPECQPSAIVAWMDYRNPDTAPDIYATVYGNCVGAVPLDGGSGVNVLSSSPNPFRTDVLLELALESGKDARVDVLDVAGRKVTQLWSGAWPAGQRTLHWDGSDALGRRVADGVYFVRVSAGGKVVSKRVVCLAR
jgi:flagellar hook capping protein FlgD